MQSPLQVLGKTSAQELNQSQNEQVIFSDSTGLTKVVRKEARQLKLAMELIHQQKVET
jgi:hypothetical protein